EQGMTMNRRSFLTAGAVGAASLLIPDALLADPLAPILHPTPGRPLRIRGQIRSGRRGIGGVAVSDGLDVALTARDGSFEILTTQDRDFVRMSVPAGYRIPQSDNGTARFFHPIQAGRDGEMLADFDLEPLDGSDEDHTVFLLADVQTEDRQETAWFHEQSVPDIQATLRTLESPEAVGIADGDIMYDNLELYSEYERGVSRMGIPFFQVVGNHDLDQVSRTDEGSTATFSRHFGPRYYSFDRGAVHYVVLDDIFWHGAGYLGYLGADQLRWLSNDLNHVEPGRPVIVSTHIPVLGGRHVRLGERNPDTGISVANRQALYRLLEPYRAHILTGHTHENEHVFEGGVHEHVNGAVCGAWWSGPICGDGTPAGYSVYSIRGEEITWRYKATGYDFDHQLRVYGRGADPSAPDEIVANIWDWDPEWQVVWYENGEPKGEMAQRVGTDPLSEELHRGDELPPRRTWVEPYPVAHLFYAPASQDAAEIRVEVTDRFGRVYSATAEARDAGGSTL
ncbi:calcineurin-like phosphoesterase C-terminal domain-containing protein, partial [Gemmatimonadota bacterium]